MVTLVSHRSPCPRPYRNHTLGTDERGIALVLYTLAMVPMLGMLALVADVGIVFAHKAQMQGALDAGVLAAASLLPTTADSEIAAARSIAVDLAGLNGYSLDPTEVVISATSIPGDTVEIVHHMDDDLIFAKLLGIQTATVSASARAQVGTLGGATGVLPLAIEMPATMFPFGEVVCLKLAADGPCSGGGGGNFLAVDIDNLGSSSASVYEEKIRLGSSSIVNIGDVLPINTGAMAGPTRQGLGCVGNNGRLTGNTETFADVVSSSGGAFTVKNWDSPRLALVPFVTSTSSTVTVQKLGIFFIDGCTEGGSSAGIQGRFIDVAKPGGLWAPLTNANYAGAKSIRLVQ